MISNKLSQKKNEILIEIIEQNYFKKFLNFLTLLIYAIFGYLGINLINEL